MGDCFNSVLKARDKNRPKAYDYINSMITSFNEIHGDKACGDDCAVVAGFGFLRDIPIALLATNRGNSPEEIIKTHFGSPGSFGYRKAERIMKLAEKFSIPILSLIDTSGADCSEYAEITGQIKAISSCLSTMTTVKVPTIALITGEACSGGAIALAASDRVFMLENSVFSVISPEACSSILFHSTDRKQECADVLKLTALDALNSGFADRIVSEDQLGEYPFFDKLSELLYSEFVSLLNVDSACLLEKRYNRFRSF